MELGGRRREVVGADERPPPRAAARVDQRRRGQPRIRTAFTKLYPELAARSPVYAELRNMIDLAVAAAYIQKQDLPEGRLEDGSAGRREDVPHRELNRSLRPSKRP